MRRSPGLALTTGLAVASLMSGCESMPDDSGSSSLLPSVIANNPSYPTMSEDEYSTHVAELQSDFSVVNGYWTSQGVHLEDTKLAVVSGTDVVQCDGAEIYSVYSLAIFCRSIGSVVITEKMIRRLYQPNSPIKSNGIDVLQFVVAHEEGHAVQQARGEDASVVPASAILPKPDNMVALELEADCYAGQAIRGAAHINPDLAVSVNIEGDVTHGSSGKRAASFDNGYSGGKCSMGNIRSSN
jgi:predicted metalloprotease